MFGINYDGLRKKKTYDELIDYVMNKQEKIQYPDRTAKFLRNSPQLSNLLDSNGEGLLEMEEQQKRQMMEVEKEHRLREMAGPSTGSVAEIKKRSSYTQTLLKTKSKSNQTYLKTYDKEIGTTPTFDITIGDEPASVILDDEDYQVDNTLDTILKEYNEKQKITKESERKNLTEMLENVENTQALTQTGGSSSSTAAIDEEKQISSVKDEKQKIEAQVLLDNPKDTDPKNHTKNYWAHKKREYKFMQYLLYPDERDKESINENKIYSNVELTDIMFYRHKKS